MTSKCLRYAKRLGPQAKGLFILISKADHKLEARASRDLATFDRSKLKAIQDASEEKLHFAWAGGLEPGQGHYYRIQGPTFLMEYDNTQDKANHIHSVWRDLRNDFGEDLLRKHYDQTPHPK